MRSLSNLSWFRRRPPVDPSTLPEVRPARDEELEPAIRLILRSSAGRPDEAHVSEFLRLARLHHSDLGGTWVAHDHDRLISAVMPITNPGRTMLIFTPAAVHGQRQIMAIGRLVDEICGRAAAQGIHLAQALLDPRDTSSQKALERCSFEPLAELMYMQGSVPPGLAPPRLPPGWEWTTYCDESHALFASTILASYLGSLDCPALNGLRDIEDILAGHRATGRFDPSWWSVLRHGDEGIGALLLSPVTAGEGFELVYLGLAPQHRGRGVANLMMQQAMAIVSGAQGSRLALAVDAHNTPALKLYWRHGLQVIGRKLALLRDLRRVEVQLAPNLLRPRDNVAKREA